MSPTIDSGFETRAIHSSYDPSKYPHYPVVPPIISSTTFRQDAPGTGFKGYWYGRSGNPCRTMLETCLQALEGESAQGAKVFATGPATATAIVTLLVKSGGHVICSDDQQPSIRRFWDDCVARRAIECTYVDSSQTENVFRALRPNTKLIWLESPSSSLLRISDIRAIKNGLKKLNNGPALLVDNTFATSALQQPLDHGADLVFYSLAEFMNGHSDLSLGAVVTKCQEQAKEFHFLQNATGLVPSPFDCTQMNRALKTLRLRVTRHTENGLGVAQFLEAHPLVDLAIHPGLRSHPQHKVAERQMSGQLGLCTFRLKGNLEPKRFVQNLRLVGYSSEIGGPRSTVSLVQGSAGTAPMLRLSLGLENEKDIREDLNQALRKIAGAR